MIKLSRGPSLFLAAVLGVIACGCGGDDSCFCGGEPIPACREECSATAEATQTACSPTGGAGGADVGGADAGGQAGGCQ